MKERPSRFSSVEDTDRHVRAEMLDLEAQGLRNCHRQETEEKSFQGIQNDESTPEEWHEKLSIAISHHKKKHEEYRKLREENLTNRSEELDIETKKLGPKVVEFIGSGIEMYNKLHWAKKLFVTGSLVAGVSLTSTVAPIISGVLATALYGQRVVGAVGLAINKRKKLNAKIEKDPEHWLANKSELAKNTYAVALAAVYMVATIGAVHEGVEALNALGVNEWLSGIFGHHEPTADVSVTPDAPHTAPVADAGVNEVITEPAHVPESVTIPAVEVPVEMPTVEASHGHGYEYLAKRLWEQLQDKHLDPSKYAEDSDIHKLLTADAQSIDKVVHQIASDTKHGFFNPDGTSVRIDMDSHMTIGADGQIHFTDATHPDIVQASPDMHTTPEYPPHHEVPAPHEEAEIHIAPEPGAPSVEDVVLKPDPLSENGPIEAISQHVYENSHGISIDPDVTHGYLSKNGIYVFGGDDNTLYEQAQKYAQEYNVSVFVDKSYKIFGLINVSRVVEFTPTDNGPLAMVIHHGPSLVPDTDNFTKRIF